MSERSASELSEYFERFNRVRALLTRAERYDDIIELLFSLRNRNVKLTLDRMRVLMHALNDPQDSYPTVLIAGSNGKGSVSTFLYSMLRQTGYRVGIFRKPHLVDYRERFIIDDEPISAGELRDVLLKVLDASEDVIEMYGEPPSFFELTTATMFLWFKLRGVQVGIVEVGLGGRLDATNVISSPLTSIITNITLEHTKTLGNSLESIAYEKSFVARPGRFLITGADGSALKVIRNRAETIGANLLVLEDIFDIEIIEDTPENLKFKLLLKGEHYLNRILRGVNETVKEALRDGIILQTCMPGRFQAMNSAIALLAYIVTVSELGADLKLEPIVRGIRRAYLPGRMEFLQLKSDGLKLELLLDTAKDILALRTLARWLRERYTDHTLICLMSLSKGKDMTAVVSALEDLINMDSRFIICEHSNSNRAIPADELASALSSAGLQIYKLTRTPREGFDELVLELKRLKMKGRRALGVVMGSLYLVGDIMRALNVDTLSSMVK